MHRVLVGQAEVAVLRPGEAGEDHQAGAQEEGSEVVAGQWKY